MAVPFHSFLDRQKGLLEGVREVVFICGGVVNTVVVSFQNDSRFLDEDQCEFLNGHSLFKMDGPYHKGTSLLFINKSCWINFSTNESCEN